MDVMALESKNAASRSTSNVAALSRAGSHVASAAASEAEVIPRLSRPAPWDMVDLPLDRVSVVVSEEGSMEVVVASEVVEVVVVSRTVDQEVVEVVLAIRVVDLAAVMVAEIEIEDLVLHHRTHQLDHDQAAASPVAMGTAKARRIAMDPHLEGLPQVGMSLAVAVLMTTEDPVGTEVVIDTEAREEATIAGAVEVTWSR
jgi:hypothetical protein